MAKGIFEVLRVRKTYDSAGRWEFVIERYEPAGAVVILGRVQTETEAREFVDDIKRRHDARKHGHLADKYVYEVALD